MAQVPVSVTAGLALFYGYLARMTGGIYGEWSDQYLERAFECVATTPVRPVLYGGFTGVAWTAEHLRPGDTEHDDVDETLLSAIANSWSGDYDLISGLVGFGVYALERIERASARHCVEAVVDRLHDTAETRADGVTWFTPPELLPPRNRNLHPHGYYNIGVAHGVAGVIALLADACRLRIRPEKAWPLLEGSVRWVLAQRLPDRRGARFPALVGPGVEPAPSRLAWCYGDPGVAATLLYAARAAGVPAWEEAAIDIALHAATSAPEDAGVQDAGLCHGAFGLAHLYNRIHQAGGGAAFAGAARLWYQRGLEMRRPGRGVAGFESWEYGPDMKVGWIADPGFLAGAAGIGLALLAGLTPVEPQWDRLLMVAIAPA